jgi:serine/threonine-protein kinase
MLQFKQALRTISLRNRGSELPARPTQQGFHVSDHIDTDFVGGATPPPALKLPGHRYRIIRKLGSGSMGEVHLAEDTKLHRRVAIKSIRADRTAAGQILRRIKRECLLHARIGAHPHIVTLFDLHDEGDQLHLVMEYVDGDTLDHVLAGYRRESRSFPIGDAVDIAIQCLHGLVHVHARGIIHRDIKPANVILTQDSAGRYVAKIMDFGVARQEEQDPDVTTLTHPGSRSPGTPLYMAPEQIDSVTYGPVVPASDLYAVGVMLYQLVAGHTPFTGSLTDVFNGHLNLEPRPIVRPSGRVPHPLLTDAIDRALEKHSHLRFASAAEFAAELESIRFLITSGDVTEESEEDDSMLASAWHSSFTRWAIAGLAGLAIAAVAFVGLRDVPIQLALDMLDGIASAPSPQSSPPVAVPNNETAETVEPGEDHEPDRVVPKPVKAAPRKTEPATKPEPLPTPAPAAPPASAPAAPAPEASAPVTPAPTTPEPAQPVAEATPQGPAEAIVDTPMAVEGSPVPVTPVTPPITPPIIPPVAPPTAEAVLDEAPVAEDTIPGLESVVVQDPYQLNSTPEPQVGTGVLLEAAELPITMEATDVVTLEERAISPIDEEVGLEPVEVAKAAEPEPAPETPAPAKTYTVQAGDTLDIIARRFGVTVGELARWNRMSNPNDLRADQVLYLYERPGLPPIVENSNALDMGKRESKSKEIFRKTKDRVKGWID